AARVTGRPFRKINVMKSIDLGGAFTSTELSDDSALPNGLRGRTTMSQHTYFSPVFVRGRRTRLEGEFDWNKGPYTARSEYTWISDDRLGQGFGGQDLPQARYKSWYASGGWVLTGEKKDRPVEPRKGGIPRGGPGALEVVGRYDWIHFGGVPGSDQPFRNPRADTILPVSNEAITFGVNWFVNRWVKFQGDVIREQIDDLERSPVPNGAAFWSQILRMQIVL